jgi:hypothetical protein
MTGAFAIIRNGCLVDASRGRAEPADILLNGDAIVPIEPRGDEPPYGELARPLDQRRIIPTIQMPELRVVSSTSSGSRSRTKSNSAKRRSSILSGGPIGTREQSSAPAAAEIKHLALTITSRLRSVLNELARENQHAT